jgi:hypothetical protein
MPGAEVTLGPQQRILQNVLIELGQPDPGGQMNSEGCTRVFPESSGGVVRRTKEEIGNAFFGIAENPQRRLVGRRRDSGARARLDCRVPRSRPSIIAEADPRARLESGDEAGRRCEPISGLTPAQDRSYRAHRGIWGPRAVAVDSQAIGVSISNSQPTRAPPLLSERCLWYRMVVERRVAGTRPHPIREVAHRLATTRAAS